MHLSEIAGQVGHEFVKEAEDHPGEWGPELLRGVIDQRIKFRKLFAKQGPGRYRRRRPEDDAPGAAPAVPDSAPDDLLETGLAG